MAYEWGGLNWNVVTDVLTLDIGDCGYPMACGNYDICSPNRQCSSLEETATSNTSMQINSRSNYYIDEKSKLEDCKKSCLKHCSCKAALFAHDWDYSKKGCLLLSEVYSLINKEGGDDKVIIFLKLQKSPIPSPTNSPPKKSTNIRVILGSGLGAFFGVCFMVAACIFIFKNKGESEGLDEFFSDQVLGLHPRLSYEELRAMTSNLDNKLGEGGFGLVFQGILSNGAKVAVKCLNGFGQAKKSFLVEVETIGNIHHFNLIFQRHQELTLGWQSRRKIIMDIAKGLTYLHEKYRQKIFHLDIKPQNILLDKYFNTKISNFGLSKLINRDQSQVATMMKETPGYLAPEWLNSIITEKVDVYGFGVMVLEMLCVCKNLDGSQPEKDMHLLSLFKRKAEEK
ncbi:G-type lectin S-receptor-like serine/threonine-protein kinase SD2-5 [Camellia sinensis]|uniref:G-type lectin S-receptor-like serine/threonine-protein kinase SD2-5 n=1 Tax=Camellia sinensis TaxID=4442 RepID=UPI001035844C|nr:G-type lectin S-receptor-like serine/threonine-protein kinase SD2-5 [Camellia sinensis]